MTIPPVDVIMAAYGLGFLAFRPQLRLTAEPPVAPVARPELDSIPATRLVYRAGRVEEVPRVARPWAVERIERAVSGPAPAR